MKQLSKAIIQVLRPTPDIEKLEIEGFGGKNVLPCWLMSLTKIKILTLACCYNGESMPSQRKLLSLEAIQSIYTE